MSKDRIVSALTVLISICIILIAILIVSITNEPSPTESKIHVVWEHRDKQESSEYKVAFEEVEYVDNEDTTLQEEKEQPAWISTDDSGLINYAGSLQSENWTLDVTYTDYLAPNEVESVKETNSKTYMKFQTLGYDSWNRQGHLARQKDAYTGKYSLRMIDNRILIAVGSYYCSTIGTYIDVLLEDGTVVPCIMGDLKSNEHTDSTNRYHKIDKSVIEFIIDSPGKDRHDYSYFKNNYPEIGSNFSNAPEFRSPVVGLRVYDKVYPIDMSDMSNDNPDGGE